LSKHRLLRCEEILLLLLHLKKLLSAYPLFFLLLLLLLQLEEHLLGEEIQLGRPPVLLEPVVGKG